MSHTTPFTAVLGIGLLLGTMGFASSANAASGSILWRGYVDNVTRITIRDGSVRDTTVFGRDAQGVNVRFQGDTLCRLENVRLETVRGRGTIELVQSPNSRNNYTAIVEVRDLQTGASSYEFRLNWNDNRGNNPWDNREENRWDNRPNPGPWGPGGRPGNDPDWNSDRSREEERAYQKGYDLGRRDYDRDRRPEYTRYRSYYNPRTEEAFRRGYLRGYSSILRDRYDRDRRDGRWDNRRSENRPTDDRHNDNRRNDNRKEDGRRDD